MFRVDLKGKVEDMIPETLKSIIQQNYLSSVGDEVTLKRLISSQINCTNSQASEIGWMVDDSVDSFVNLELRKTDMENYIFGEEGNIWTNLFGKVGTEESLQASQHCRLNVCRYIG